MKSVAFAAALAALVGCPALSAFPALAEAPKPAAAPTPPPAPSTLLLADHLFDAMAGVLRDHQAVLVGPDGKIAAVGAADTVKTPANARRIQFPPGATLLPGLIDAHTHLLMDFDRNLGGDDPNTLLNVAQASTAKRALLGVRNGREDLLAGITTVRDLGNSGLNGDVALKGAIEAGWVQGPRIMASTRALAPIGGQFPRMIPQAQPLIEQEYVTVTGADAARAAVRQAKYDGADVIKVIVDNAYNVLALDEMKAIVEEAHRRRMKVAAHAVNELAVSTAIDAGVDSIEHAYGASDASLARMAERHIYLVPTDEATERWSSPTTPQAMRVLTLVQHRLKKAVELGVPIALGSDAYYRYPDATRGQISLEVLRSYLRAGLTPAQTLQAATINAATLLGLDAKIGSLEPGKIADIVATPGDPLKVPALVEHISFVMKAGEVVKDEMSAGRR